MKNIHRTALIATLAAALVIPVVPAGASAARPAASPAVRAQDTSQAGTSLGEALAKVATGARNYVVRFKESVNSSERQRIIADRKGKLKRQLSSIFSGSIVELTPAQAAQLAKSPSVDWVRKDVKVRTQVTQSPSPSWGLDRIDQRSLPLGSSYVYASTGKGVTAYIVDTGINLTHNDFAGRVRAGYDVWSQGASDCQGHGTHVAGTVGGTTYGVAKEVSLVAVRVLDCSGSGTMSGVIAGIDWAIADHGSEPAVMNMSLGGGFSQGLNDAVDRAVADGINVVVAAGNSNVDACTSSPASTASALTVGSTTSTDARSSFSNFGRCLDIFAPGSSITSTYIGSNTATAVLSGTSMASPHVAGIVARYLQGNPGASPSTVSSAITAAATAGVVTGAGTGSPNLLAYANPNDATAPSTTTTVPVTTTTAVPVTTTTVPVTTTTAVPVTTTTVPVTTTTAVPVTTTTVPVTTTTAPIRRRKPARPKDVSASRPTWTTATIRWTNDSENVSLLPVTGHVVQVYFKNWFFGTILLSTVRTDARTTQTIRGLVPGLQYTFRVAAINAEGVGEYSAESNTIPRFG